MKIIFFGTSQFAVPTLQALAKDADFDIKAVVSETDKPAGRKMILQKSPVKILSEKENFKIFQPNNLEDDDFKNEIKKISPDVCVVASYGKIIPPEIIKIPKCGFINIHPSLLPKYRGASPIQSAILAGDKETGVTIIILDKKMDHGPIIAQEKYKISPTDDYLTLEKQLAKFGAKLLVSSVKKYMNGKIKPKPQDEKKATHTKRFYREDGKIDFKKSAKEIERMIRAFNPWPGAWTEIKNIGRIKITKASLLSFPDLPARQSLLVRRSPTCPPKPWRRWKGEGGSFNEGGGDGGIGESDKPKNFPVGKFFEVNGKLAVKCGNGVLNIEKLIPEGKKEMSGEEFLRGHHGLTKI